MFANTIQQHLRRKYWNEILTYPPLARAALEFLGQHAAALGVDVGAGLAGTRAALSRYCLAPTATSYRAFERDAGRLAELVSSLDDTGDVSDLFAAELQALEAGGPHGLRLAETERSVELQCHTRRAQTMFAAASALEGFGRFVPTPTPVAY